MTTKIAPVHPGEILREDFLVPLGLSQGRLARDLNVPPVRVSQIVAGKRAVTTDTALRLAAYFGTSPEFWLNLQARYELDRAEDDGLVADIARDVRPRRDKTAA